VIMVVYGGNDRVKTNLSKMIVIPVLAAGLLLAPLSGLGAANVQAAGATVAVAAQTKVQVTVDGNKLAGSAFEENGTVYVPMRALFKELGATVSWEKNTQTIFARRGAITVSLQVGKKEAIVNGKAVKLEAAPVVRQSVTYVPVHLVREAWDSKTKVAKLLTPLAQQQAEFEEWLNEQESLPKLTTTEIVDQFDESVVMITTNVAQGSGVVVGEQLILTNYHVIEDASSATVLTLYGDNVTVEGVVAYDERTDLAIIKTKEELYLNPVALNTGMTSRKGDKVVAIGSPYGLQNTVSDGLISNITYMGGVRYVQTSAPIDHGSSGGGLFNEYGELVGINTFGYGKSGAELNFAVSSLHAAILMYSVEEEKLAEAKFLPSPLPNTLVGIPLADVAKLMQQQFGTIATTEGEASLTKWDVQRDAAGWTVLTANIDPRFYMYYGPSTANELRIWAINLGYTLHDLLPNEKIRVLINFERDYEFELKDLAPGEITSLGGGKWRVKFPVIDLQLKDQLYIKVRD
jgi:serine protease Do